MASFRSALPVLVLALALTGCTETPEPESAKPRGAAPTRLPEQPPADPDAPSGWGPTEGDLYRAAELVADLDDADLAATVVMPGFWGYDAQAPSPAEQVANREMHGVPTPARLLRKRHHVALFLRPEVIGDVGQVTTLTSQLARAARRPDGLPLLLAIDQEGGSVQRLDEGVPPVPSAASVGATGDLGYARRVARANGATLRRAGVTMVFAPVADVDPDGSSALGSRVYGSEPRPVARMAVASMRGYLQAGILPVVKHFPGLGTVTGDSHRELTHQTAPMRTLWRRDLLPFRAAVAAGAPVVMAGHQAVDVLGRNLPASVNPRVVQGVLRDQLGFQGVVVTDSHGMVPINIRYGPARGAVMSLQAGVDLILNSPRPERAWQAIRRAVDDGRIERGRLVEAATRVTALRLYLQRLQRG